MFNWPENIVPLPSASFSMKNESSVIRSKMESGRFRQRRRFTNEFETAALNFDLNDLEFSSFKGIWKHKLLNGSNWFTIRLPAADGEGEELTLTEVRFTSNYSTRHEGFLNWSVSAPIEFKESTTISHSVLDVWIANGYDTQAFIDAVDDFDNIFPSDWEYTP